MMECELAEPITHEKFLSNETRDDTYYGTGNGSQGKPQLEVTVRGEDCGGLVWGSQEAGISS